MPTALLQWMRWQCWQHACSPTFSGRAGIAGSSRSAAGSIRWHRVQRTMQTARRLSSALHACARSQAWEGPAVAEAQLAVPEASARPGTSGPARAWEGPGELHADLASLREELAQLAQQLWAAERRRCDDLAQLQVPASLGWPALIARLSSCAMTWFGSRAPHMLCRSAEACQQPATGWRRRPEQAGETHSARLSLAGARRRGCAAGHGGGRSRVRSAARAARPACGRARRRQQVRARPRPAARQGRRQPEGLGPAFQALSGRGRPVASSQYPPHHPVAAGAACMCGVRAGRLSTARAGQLGA